MSCLWWAGSDDQERRVKEETGATIHCFPLDQPGTTDTCFYTGQQAERIALFAKAYCLQKELEIQISSSSQNHRRRPVVTEGLAFLIYIQVLTLYNGDMKNTPKR